MNAIFTIVAKNYLPLAFVQAETIKKHNPEISHFILLADGVDELDLTTLSSQVDTLDVLNIERLEDLEFKYNLTEFCTSVKPFYINYLFGQGFKKVIYLDPDVCVFSSVQPILDELNEKSIVVTPHFITPELEYSGTITEQLLLHVGIFNLGFVAVANKNAGKHFVDWWQNRLYSMSYQDKVEALHTDQKWVDLAPIFYGDELLISKDIGRNMAFWNLHERKLTGEDTYEVENRISGGKTPLMLFHFAGYDIDKFDKLIHKHFEDVSIDRYPELKGLFVWYKNELLASGYKKFISLKYSYNNFSNGSPITNFQRRLFRRLVDEGSFFEKPFSVGEGSFYQLLAESKLLSIKNIDGLKHKNVEEFSGKINKLNFFSRKIKYLIGFDNYSLLLKFCMRYLRPENQTFLFNNESYHKQFKNENKG